MQPVCFEQHLDRYVETGHLLSEVIIETEMVLDVEKRSLKQRGNRISNAPSKVLSKIYTVNDGVYMAFGKVSSSILVLESGDVIEINGTLHNAFSTGIRFVFSSLPDSSPQKNLSTTFKAIPHEFRCWNIKGIKLKKSSLKEPKVIEVYNIKDTNKKSKK